MANATAEKQDLHLRVRVEGWSYARHVVLRDKTVEMEVARTHCSHCSTCRGRMHSCISALSGKPYERRSAGGGEYIVLQYPVEAARDEASVVAFLRERFQLPLSVAA